MAMIMMSAAALMGRQLLRTKNSGTPMSAPPPKQISCRFVKLNMTLVFTEVRSFGMSTYAKSLPP